MLKIKWLRWRQNGRDSVSNHQPRHCLLSLLFGRRSKKTSKLRVTGLCVGNSPGPVNSPHKGPVTRKMFPFDDVIMWFCPVILELLRSMRTLLTDWRVDRWTNTITHYTLYRACGNYGDCNTSRAWFGKEYNTRDINKSLGRLALVASAR